MADHQSVSGLNTMNYVMFLTKGGHNNKRPDPWPGRVNVGYGPELLATCSPGSVTVDLAEEPKLVR
jgi:hypothetical protein